MLNQDFREFIGFLNARAVRYLIIGGYAVAYHGHPRYTKDIGIWLALDQLNAERIETVLQDFGFGSLGLTADDFLEPDTVIQLGRPPRRIDLLIGLKGMDFETCFQNRENVDVDGLTVSFIDRDNLVKTKRLAGRHQDLADIEQLAGPSHGSP